MWRYQSGHVSCLCLSNLDIYTSININIVCLQRQQQTEWQRPNLHHLAIINIKKRHHRQPTMPIQLSLYCHYHIPHIVPQCDNVQSQQPAAPKLHFEINDDDDLQSIRSLESIPISNFAPDSELSFSQLNTPNPLMKEHLLASSNGSASNSNSNTSDSPISKSVTTKKKIIVSTSVHPQHKSPSNQSNTHQIIYEFGSIITHINTGSIQ